MTVYVTSYLHISNSDTNLSTMYCVFPLIVVFYSFGSCRELYSPRNSVISMERSGDYATSGWMCGSRYDLCIEF